MGLNSVPLAERINIGFFGKRNAGKSSLVNAFTNQDLSIVSCTKGTTTDPVHKTMELLPLGPVTVIDTPGYDDEGPLGSKRIKKTNQVLNIIDIAVLVIDSEIGLTSEDEKIISLFKNKNISYVIAYNKCDLVNKKIVCNKNEISVSAINKINIEELKSLIASINIDNSNSLKLVKDIVNPFDTVILVTPIDSAAPKGRLILPQQQVIRELLDLSAISVIVKENELENALDTLKIKPKLVITDSQVFQKVSDILPDDILLTSFSILFARYKGVLKEAVLGVKSIEKLNDGDVILISEGCTHHRQCDDIGSVKIPMWMKYYTGKALNFEFSSGNDFPENLLKYKMIIHCGACMLKDKEVIYRYNIAKQAGIPISNYGITIAYLHKILKRSLKVFPDIYNIL